MTKKEFIEALSWQLKALPKKERESSLAYYEEMIGESMEDGLSEEEAVAAAGTPEEASEEIFKGLSLIDKARMTISKSGRSRNATKAEKVLICLGLPILIPLIIAAVSIGLALFVTAWAVFLSWCAVLIALIAGGVGIFAFGIAALVRADAAGGLMYAGAGLVCSGIGLFLLPTIKPLFKLMKKHLKITVNKEADHEEA